MYAELVFLVVKKRSIYLYVRQSAKEMMIFLTFRFFTQNVKAYLRRGTARESLLLYKEAIKGEMIFITKISEAALFTF